MADEMLKQTELARLGGVVQQVVNEFISYALDSEQRDFKHCEGQADTIRRQNAELATLRAWNTLRDRATAHTVDSWPCWRFQIERIERENQRAKEGK